MFPLKIWLTYTAACVLLVLSPGPDDNFLAIGRGLSQGKRAALVSGISSGAGILFHVATATCGLTLLMQTSEVAFWLVKLFGAAYLVWLSIKVLRSRSLVVQLSPLNETGTTAGAYPTGEGAGYAGGTMSAGVDGIEVAEALARAMLGKT